MLILKGCNLTNLFNTMLHCKVITTQLNSVCHTPRLAELWQSTDQCKAINSGHHRRRFRGCIVGYNSVDHEYIFVNMWDNNGHPVVRYNLIGASSNCSELIPLTDKFIGAIMQYGIGTCPVKTLLFKTDKGGYYIKELNVKQTFHKITTHKILYPNTNNPLRLLDNKWAVKNTSNPDVRLIVCKDWKVFYVRRMNGGTYKVSYKCVVQKERSSRR